jgi:phytoene dehydrogenase-like protein
MSKHYDVAVLGGGIGALSAAVLLARRSWRVLVVGQGHRPWRYSFDGLPLGRRPFTLLAGQSPAWSRILIEIAQSQTFQRRARAVEPMAQIIGSEFRFELPTDPALFGKEVDREFPAVRRVVDDLLADLAQTNLAADAAFNQDVLWPPHGFWEKRETARTLAAIPRADGTGDVLSELSADHPYRTVAEVPAMFASDLVGPLPPFAFARLCGAWVRGLLEMPRGEDDVVDLLTERIRAHGGEIEMHDRATKLRTKGSKVVGVELEGGQSVGVQFVVGEMPASELVGLASDYAPSRRALAAMPTLTAKRRRFVVAILLEADGLPELLGRESFLLTGQADVAVHVQQHEVTVSSAKRVLLVAETLLPEGVHPRAWRERVLKILETQLPFIERHYVLVDSPHDGRPLWDYRSGARVEVERALLRGSGGAIDPEPMAPQVDVTPPQLHGLAGDGLRTPVGNAFVVGRSCMPALGQEGELLSAWGVARIITRTDRRKEKMRREMWSKIEFR